MSNLRQALPLFFVVASLHACGADEARLLHAAQAIEHPVVTLPSAVQHRHGDVVENSYIVMFRAQSGASRLKFSSFPEEYRHHFRYLAETFLSDTRVSRMRYITTLDLAHPKDPARRAELQAPAPLQLAWTSAQLDELPGHMVAVDFPDDATARQVLGEWEAQKKIWYAEPNYVNRRMDGTGNPYTSTLAQTYHAAGQWWHALIKLPQALDRLAASNLSSVAVPVVAVLDSGVDIQNQYLKNNIWTNARPGQSGCANDVNGCNTTTGDKGVLGDGDVYPYTTTGFGQECPGDPSSDENGTCGHGTHVSGIIAANVDASAMIGGVCPVCQIMPVKIIANINGSGAASDEAILTGFKYITLFKNVASNQAVVRVSNSSFGKYVYDRSVALLVTILKEPPNEVLVVGAAGNEDSMLRSYPAAFTDAVAVASVGPNMEKAVYSNFGPWVSVAAPGGDATDSGDDGAQVNSTIPGVSDTGYKQGTSMACPMVAGLAGLVLSYDPGRAWQDLRNSIINTADPSLYNPSVNSGINYNYYYQLLSGEDERRPLLGSGIIDASAALDNSATTGYLGPQTQRVTAACGTMASKGAIAPRWWLLLLLVPVVLPAWCQGPSRTLSRTFFRTFSKTKR